MWVYGKRFSCKKYLIFPGDRLKFKTRVTAAEFQRQPELRKGVFLNGGIDAKVLSLAIDELWELLKQHQEEEFLTAKKLPFAYVIRGGEMFVDRRSKSITKATFSRALEKIKGNPEGITGPKALNVFGAPYIFAILRGLSDKLP